MIHYPYFKKIKCNGSCGEVKSFSTEYLANISDFRELCLYFFDKS